MRIAVRAAQPGGAQMFFASRLAIWILALMLSPAFAAAPTARDPAKGNPRLASLQIEVWPEFDRTAAALVILKGEIAANIALPVRVSLRIPASSGGPTAVAYSAASGGDLANLKYDNKNAGEFITLVFDAPERVFHVEFYDPVATTTASRSYTYSWTGDLAVDRLRVLVQEPATASDLAVLPALDATAVGQDGLRSRSADLGAYDAGKRLELKVRYTKTDPRVSTEILTSRSPDPSPRPTEGPSKAELAIWLVGMVAVMGLGIWAAMMWWYGRKKQSESPPVCPKCRAPSTPDARFCSQCGAKMA